ncbi:hypothetical protein [Paenibacillus aceris]|uniref:Uncharacterized protein n=1 Tax=Paenibacillus aceris TaxID=869555 RepID=A0ABS4IAC5_9BACL|nr:hypothetical protein [Paenibacillus aceris]MBP1967885.1 hypothetical protein [Paenibacillus aceris]NHW39029.1 hypothetical protein [Paenibacillus aceris]
MSHITRSTGILQNSLDVEINAHIEVVNLDDESHRVRVKVFDWGLAGAAGVPVQGPIATLLNFNDKLSPSTRIALNADILAGHHYEVRVTHSKNESVMINVFGREGDAGNPFIEGNTVLDSEFVELEES